MAELEPGQVVRVVADYERCYPDPLTVSAGERVQVGRRDEEWPGYVWCTAGAGRAGWVPERYLEQSGSEGVLRCDYSARELSVRAGELLTVELEESGWVWARNAAGESGWVPVRNLGPSQERP